MAKTVAEIMTRDPVVVTSQTSLDEAIQIMAERRFSGLPVVDTAGKLVGIISQGDLMWRESGVTPPPYIMVLDSVIYLENPAKYQRDLHKALGQTVGEVMTKNPQTIRPEKSLREAAELMHEKGVHRLPVIDSGGKPIGILTRGDIVRAMATEEG
ncbi:CBS domain-containing protein [Oscillatoria sp. HE19RPO]|uniref:CBS domain-containing protein n=1 Tax=Oscillatoria sp. HE19RPO TaxID=2954806 RepID=UPI0020C4BA80|nr:CBS domain-containing protein [Oscillatoria sp. HE19RPO]